MAVCEWCSATFDRDDAETTFSIETSLNYDNLRTCLCGDCAVEAIEDEVDGVYFETCERCGKVFDLFEDSLTFSQNFSDCSGTVLRDHWDHEILCCNCAIDDVNKLDL